MEIRRIELPASRRLLGPRLRDALEAAMRRGGRAPSPGSAHERPDVEHLAEALARSIVERGTDRGAARRRR